MFRKFNLGPDPADTYAKALLYTLDLGLLRTIQVGKVKHVCRSGPYTARRGCCIVCFSAHPSQCDCLFSHHLCSVDVLIVNAFIVS